MPAAGLRSRVSSAAVSAAFCDVAPRALHRGLDVDPALGERPEHRLRYVSQLAQAVAPDVPGEAERSELGPQGGAVERAGGHLPGEEVSPVGSRPATVGTLDQVRDDDMGVELGIASPAGAVTKGRPDEPVGFDQLGPTVATAGIAGLLGEVVEYGGDGPVVGGRDRVTDPARPEGPEQGDALWSGERQVVAGPAARLDLQAQRLTVRRVPGQQVPQGLRFDLADEPEPFGRRPDPLSGCLAAAEVVVVDVVGDLLEVVVGSARGAEPPYRQHGDADRSVRSGRSMDEWSVWTSPRTSSQPTHSQLPGRTPTRQWRGVPPGGRRAPFGARVWNVSYRSGGADGRDMTKPPSSMEGGFVGGRRCRWLPGVGHGGFRGARPDPWDSVGSVLGGQQQGGGVAGAHPEGPTGPSVSASVMIHRRWDPRS